MVTRWLLAPRSSVLARQTCLADLLNEMRKEGHFVDVILHCDKQCIPAHRVVISSRSALLKRILVRHDSVSNLHVKHITPHLTEVLVEYMYHSSSDVLSTLSVGELFQLLVPARKLEIPGAIHDVYYAILEKNDPNTIRPLWQWAKEAGDPGAIQLVISCIISNLPDMLSENLFGTLSWDEMFAIATNLELDQKKCYFELAAAIMQWLKSDTHNRMMYTSDLSHTLKLDEATQKCLADMMPSCVPFKETLDTSFQRSRRNERTASETRLQVCGKCPCPVTSKSNCGLVDCSSGKSAEVRTKRTLSKSPDFKKKVATKSPEIKNSFLESDLKNVKTLAKESPSCSKNDGPREMVPRLRLDKLFPSSNSRRNNELLLVGLDKKKRVVIQCYLPKKCVWTVPQDINIPYRCNFMCTYKRGFLYIVGGEDANGCKYGDTFIYDLSSRVLNKGTNLRIARSDAGIAVCRDNVYIIGGHNFETTLSSVERLNTSNPKLGWRIMHKSLRKPCYASGIVVNKQEQVFVIGGYSECCQCYIPAEEACIELPALPEFYRCCGLFSGIHKAEIYVFRRHRPLEYCIINLERGEYRTTRTIGTPPEEVCSLVKLNNQFWAFDRSGKLFTLNPINSKWTIMGSCAREIIKPLHMSVVHDTYGLTPKQTSP